MSLGADIETTSPPGLSIQQFCIQTGVVTPARFPARIVELLSVQLQRLSFSGLTDKNQSWKAKEDKL